MLDETKQNIQNSIEEARNQIPRYNQAIYNYQEQVLALQEKLQLIILILRMPLYMHSMLQLLHTLRISRILIDNTTA